MTCEKHGQYEGNIATIGEKEIRSFCPHCTAERKRIDEEQEKRAIEARKDFRIRELLGQSGVPVRFKERTLDNFRASTEGQKRALQVAQGYAENFEDRLRHGGGLVFCGKPGTGKTHLACGIANHVIHTGRRAVFMSVLKAIRTVKDTYRKDSNISEQEAINSLIDPELLVLDEVGVQFGSETEKMIMFEVMNGRYEQVRPTIVLSNLAREELGAYLGERVLDRLQEGGGVVVAFDWDSYRTQVHKDTSLPSRKVSPVDYSTGML